MSSAFVKKVIVSVIIISIVGLFTPGRAEANTPDDALLNTLPENCMFCLRINNFNDSLGKMDQYLAGASPIPVSLAMLVNMQLIGVTGDPMMNGIDMTGDFAVFAIPPQTDQTSPSAGFLIPVKNYNEFVTNNPNCNKLGETGVAVLSAPNSPVGGFIMTEVCNGKYALVVSENEKAKLAILNEAIRINSKPLVQRISAAQAKEAVSAPAWVYVNLAGLYDQYEDQAEAGIEFLEQQMKSDMQKSSADMGGMEQFMDLYIDMLPEILEEFGGAADSATIALTPSPALLTLDVAFQAKDGSELAKSFIKNPKATGTYTMTGYMDDNNAVNGLMKMNIPSMKNFYDIVFEIAKDASDDDKLKDQIEDFRKELEKTYDAMGEEVAFSFSYAGGMPPFQFHEVVEITKPDVMKNYMKNSLGLANDMYKSIGIPATLTYESGVSTYKDATIDTLSFNFTESNDPNMIAMKQEFEKMYGTDGFKYYFAQSPDKFYMVMGADGLGALKSVIDRPVSSPASGDIKIAIDTLQGTGFNEFACSVNIIKLIKGVGQMMEAMPTQAPGMEMIFKEIISKLDFETQSTLVLGGQAADGQASMRLALPKQHLIEIVAMGVQIQQQMMAQQQAAMQNQGSMDMQTAPAAAATPMPVEPVETASQPKLETWIGKPAPDLKMVDLQGNVNRVSRLKGKKVMLDFWATWCPPCKKSIPELIKLRTDTKPSELVIFGLSDEPIDRLNEFTKEAKMNYPVVAYNNGDLPTPYNQVNALPTLILIDSKGVIRDILVGYHPIDEIESKLDKLN